MKLTKTTLLAALFAGGLFACSSARAQDTNAPAAGMATNHPPILRVMPSMMNNMAVALNLTDEQKTNVQPILDDQRHQMIAIFQDRMMPPEEKRAKIQEIRNDTATKLQAVLTPEQLAKWQKMQPHLLRLAPPTPNGTNAPAAHGP
jgi:Spy/CpxP family protein refolding chaperone